jgi:fucose 4-O-acetylase-like acetyltransferase
MATLDGIPMPPVRDARIDNAKLILIALVIFGHCLEGMRPASPIADYAYHILYGFHVPALVFLLGMTSKPAPLAAHFGSLRLLLLFQLLYVLLLSPRHFDFLTEPYHLLWFLLCLFYWRASLPWLARIPFILPLSILAALAAGCIPTIGYAFSASRAMVFLPFFLAGYRYGAMLLEWGRTCRISALRYGCLALACIALSLTPLVLRDVHWLYGAGSYAALHVADGWGIAFRTLQFAVASIGILALLAWVPNTPLWQGRGAHILPVYLLHGLWVLPLRFVFLPLTQFSLPLAMAVALLLTWRLIWLLTKERIRAPIAYLYTHSWRESLLALRRKLA